MSTVLIADRDMSVQDRIAAVFEGDEMEFFVVTDESSLLASVGNEESDVAILDTQFCEKSGLSLYRQIYDLDPRLPVIFVTNRADSRQAIEATKLGAIDYLIKPLDEHELARSLRRAIEIRRLAYEPVSLNPDDPAEEDGDAMIGQCAAMQDVYKSIGLVASQNVTVLVRGESGTGKELVARALFQFGNRADQLFMAINCAAIPDALLESELFGHEKGAFTGADKQRIGKFEQCNGGTLFLDEIGDMSAVLQSKLLRVLQEQSFERVGGNNTIKTDVRVISATHRNLEEMVQAGQFRGDLFYRLNGYTIWLPPLSEREGDLAYLIEHFRKLANRELNKKVKRFSSEAIEILQNHDWPGNVRELQSAVRRAILQTTGAVVIPDFLPELDNNSGSRDIEKTKTLKSELHNLIQQKILGGDQDVYDSVIERVERELISQVLQFTDGNQVEASKILGITRTTLRSKISKLGIQITRTVEAN